MSFLKTAGRSYSEEYYEEQEGLSPVSIGIAWGSRILAFSVEFALIVVFGYMIDEHFGVSPWAFLVCTAIGFCSFVSGIILTAKRMERIEARAGTACSVAKVDKVDE